jgi:hypothetical protein
LTDTLNFRTISYFLTNLINDPSSLKLQSPAQINLNMMNIYEESTLNFWIGCPIRIEIITGSHIFILFLPRVVTLFLHFTPRYRSWSNIRHKVSTRGNNNINIRLPVIIS